MNYLFLPKKHLGLNNRQNYLVYKDPFHSIVHLPTHATYCIYNCKADWYEMPTLNSTMSSSKFPYCDTRSDNQTSFFRTCKAFYR